MNSATPTHLRPSADDVSRASDRIRDLAHRTPLMRSRSISDRAGLEVLIKCENLQRSGSFKIRGASNALAMLAPDSVVAFSSGNHAQAVALAASIRGISATIVMPPDSMPSKLAATRAYGADVVTDGVTPSNRAAIAEAIARETGATLIPPFDHPAIIAGAGTVAREILDERPDVRTIIAPLGGGGLLAGTCLIREQYPHVTVFGVEPEEGDDGQQSLAAGRVIEIEPPDTIADGARTIHLGEINFSIIRDLVEGVVTVDDQSLLETTRWAISRTKLLIEPTGALPLAALFGGRFDGLEAPVALVISGGNVDLERLVSG